MTIELPPERKTFSPSVTPTHQSLLFRCSNVAPIGPEIILSLLSHQWRRWCLFAPPMLQLSQSTVSTCTGYKMFTFTSCTLSFLSPLSSATHLFLSSLSLSLSIGKSQGHSWGMTRTFRCLMKLLLSYCRSHCWTAYLSNER